jgi:Caspase domain
METMGYWWTELGRNHPKVRAMWWPVALVLCAQMLFVGGSWAQERRTALVIGNSAYQKSPLVNPVNDAQAMAATLEPV